MNTAYAIVWFIGFATLSMAGGCALTAATFANRPEKYRRYMREGWVWAAATALVFVVLWALQ